jgi:hypothetical protein
VGLEDFRLGPFQHAIETPEDRQRQDDILVLTALEGVADKVCNTPKKTDDLAVVHDPPRRNYLNLNQFLNLPEKQKPHHQYQARHTRQSQARNGTIMK